MKLKAQIMDEAALGRALMRISHEINEHNRGVDNVVLIGVRRRGEPIAQRIRGNIHKIEDREVPCGSLDIKFYRDDLSRLSELPETRRAALPFDVTDRDVVLCDDVMNIPTSRSELVEVRLPEFDGETGVYLMDLGE